MLIKYSSETRSEVAKINKQIQYKKALKLQARTFQQQGNRSSQKLTPLELNQQVNHRNQMLLNKLVEISQGKQTSLPVNSLGTTLRNGIFTSGKTEMSMQQQSDPLFNNRSQSLNQTKFNPVPKQQPKSLNMVVRKRENERIERENHAFAKRLFSNPGIIKKREMDQSYEQYVKNRTRISKAHKLSPLRLTSVPGFNLSSSKLLGAVKQGS